MQRTTEQIKQSALEGRANRGLPLDERFWKKAVRDETTSCWNWTSTRTGRGYGSFTIQNRTRSAHRIAWELTRGEIPNGFQICHHCDNPICVSPFHIFAGTGKDNQQDCIRKGRKKIMKGSKNPMFGKRGELCVASVLTSQKVREIRHQYSTGKFNQTDLAKLYGVTQVNVSAIIRGKTWSHVPLQSRPALGKITEAMKKVIRDFYAPGARKGPGSAHELAKRLGVPKYTVSGYYQRFKGSHRIA